MTKVALITGITGQDGAYLASMLLQKGYEVHGLRQPSSVPDTIRIEKILNAVHLHYGDMTDGPSIAGIVRKTRPDEIYNLAGQSHVGVSFDAPEYTAQVNALGVLRLLETVRAFRPQARLFQASTSELFGDTPAPQNENSSMNPRSPYAAAKKYAYDMVRIYREAYGLYACNGIMFNHESAQRGEDFVTRKIAMAAAAIAKGGQDCLTLGNLDAKRDWSHVSDIMEGAWLMMKQDRADDYILASGQSYTVRELAGEAFRCAGIGIVWTGEGLEEKGLDARSGKTLIGIDPALFRTLEVDDLRGDPAKARKILNWRPRLSFAQVVREMVEAELGYAILPEARKIHA